ncbi:MAG TPA: DegV family protein [Peptococcaceae bacterium]|nr:DegV family protein [Peptococcaceae bacterium]
MIHVVTDSCVDLPAHLLKQYNIRVVPLSIRVNGKEFMEGVNITPREFYREMAASVQLPQTSQPTPAQFANVFKELAGKGKVLCLTISSKLSGSYGSAVLGKEIAGNSNVTVFDTLAASIGQGLQVIKAAQLINSGLSLEHVLEFLHKMREEMKFIILLDTLENIVKGGRLSKFQGSIAKLLNIKVILHNVKGSVEVLEKVRGKNKSLQRVIDLLGERCEDFSSKIIGITHVDNLEDAEHLAQEIKVRYQPQDVLVHEMGATISTYAGKAGLIVAF